MDLIITPLDQTVDIPNLANIKLTMDNQNDLSNISLNELNVTIKYNPDFLKPEPMDSIISGRLIAGKFLPPYADSTTKIGELHLKIKAISNNILNGSGELFSMNFETYFPTDTLNYSDIVISIEPVNNTCTKFETAVGRINAKLQCLNELRKIKYSGLKYELENVSPNPVNSLDANFNFTIAIDADTEFYIQNSLGEIISKPVNSRLTKGTYKLNIPLKEISSGLYFYTLKSGPFVETKKLIINK